ncbi:SusD/RagB family nutrient-binding outer membrane lipoprotein [Mucilaginibacter sp. BJC16-A38]|uniref:SusD/RagB family nutrient-binding outer membrane lipoprotein n=1 Tax=Mucilaginibacter phenanthrenivorans TaxID=1234842 RepID=UPI0021573233|nr:SusD/RagB family nutrient-binding outer membrane lipoprotein [Mucilaginibacter phenanthrenivorans]MCR8557827.1 SusD/RagB family nutrient-binding outer membrane lipoprotein [Mucilaginibacter phenanthrenivorans]
MKKTYKYTLSALLILSAASCKKLNDFGKTNQVPDAVTTPIPSALIANVEKSVGGYSSTSGYAVTGGYYAQYFAETQYPGTSLYDLVQQNFAGDYNGTLYDAQTVINTPSSSKNAVAAATIMQQYIYWILTDNMGDLPYSQALQGIKAITPAYDTSEDIYKGIVTKTAAAVAALSGSGVEGDVVYGGDITKWKKFGNSLIILVTTQASKTTEADSWAKPAFASAVAGGYISTNDANFSVPYTADYHNPWYALYDGRKDEGESTTVTALTASLNDGRQLMFGGAANDPNNSNNAATPDNAETSSVGVPYGLGRTDANNFIAKNQGWAYIMRADIRLQTSPVIAVSASEVLLAVAEGVSLGWTSGTASTIYVSGIQASFDQWGVAAPSAGYLANVPFSAKNLAIQQYLAGYPNGHIGWNVWRKTGYPALTPAPAHSNTSGLIPRRLEYNSTELQTNTASAKAAIAREKGKNPGTDSQDNAVWWDVTGLAQ